ncbi:MAG TPA: phenylalanine--tRNA ligase subunit beta, partial [Flavobacteriaceae bacterium]|nr:phenylalanine--tRNA ligase subunit beta [Flavobacteriaceae bacterium]
TPLSEIYEVFNDQVFEIGLTPNRSDAMSHYGVARDLYAGLYRQGINKALQLPSTSKFRIDDHTRHIPILVEDTEKAPRYCGITLTDVEVKESPMWLKNRLTAIGVGTRNNIVDATNYVMHALGQPFHAFDADRISGQKITVKTVEEGTVFETLDGVERKLGAEDLMICDEKKPLCIAGVYGGKSSGVTDITTNIFLESAYFDPVSIRKTAKRHGLNTDASFRFERGIDPTLCDFALKYLVTIIQELAGGRVSSDINDFYPKKIQDFGVFLRYEKIHQLVGQKIDHNDLKTILASLKIKVKNITESGMGLEIPPFRADVKREIDVIEEILRVYGYNQVDIGKKINATIALNNKHDDHNVQNVVANQLIAQGFYEIMNNSLIETDHIFPEVYEKENTIDLINPLSHELESMRQSLVVGGLESLAFNINRQKEDLKFFEFGKTYHKIEDTYKERKHLCLFLTGQQEDENWNAADNKSEIFYTKGILTALFERLGLDVTYKPLQGELFSESLEMFLKEKSLGYFGVLKSKICKQYDVDQEVLFADIYWDEVLELIASRPKMTLKPINKFPIVRRDFALLLDTEISFAQIEEIAFATEKNILRKVGLFDVYEGKTLPEGKKSYAVSFIFSDQQKTLTDNRVDKIMKKLRTRFENQLGAELR